MLIEHCISTDHTLALPAYAAQLPPLDALVVAYGVPPGIAWGLWRPVVAALEPQLLAELRVRARLLLLCGCRGVEALRCSVCAVAATHACVAAGGGCWRKQCCCPA